MALRLKDLIVGGELLNTRKSNVHGYLGLRGFERPLVIQLTGNCAADLADRHIRFEVRHQSDQDDHVPGESARLARLNLSGLAWEQIGPTGTMTAARKARGTDCPPSELHARCKPVAAFARWTGRCLSQENHQPHLLELR